MTKRRLLYGLVGNDRINFILTNRIPRRTLTRLMGRLAKIEQPLVRDLSMAVWRHFSDLDLSDAKKTEFKSLHDCFVRELKEGARPIDPDPAIITSPCDAIVGMCGEISDGSLLQVKGSRYRLDELVLDPEIVAQYRQGTYVTLRLTASMYHHFHAPCDGRVIEVAHIAGDAWNVNPPTLSRVKGVFCRNERAVIRLRQRAPAVAPDTQTGAAHEAAAAVTPGGAPGTHRDFVLIPVAAILVAGIKLRFMELPADRRHSGRWRRSCDVAFKKGEPMGWFEHGSTIIVLAPSDVRLASGIEPGRTIRMGMALLREPIAAVSGRRQSR